MEVSKLASDVGISLVYVPQLDNKGWYLPNAFEYGERGAIFLRDDLDPIEVECVVLHEIGHLLTSNTLTTLSAPQLHIVNETKADRYMLEQKAKEWLQESDDEYINIYHFLDFYHFATYLYDMAVQVFNTLLGIDYAY